MRALLIPCVAFCSLALSGCSVVYSLHPLAIKDDAVDEPALAGQWKPSHGDDDAQLCIQRGDQGTYSMIITATDSDSDDESNPGGDPKSDKKKTLVETYDLTLVQLENQLFADMSPKDMALDGTKIEPLIGTVAHHLIVKLNVTDDDLAYSGLRTGAVREAKEQGWAPMDFLEIDDGLLLTASTEDLRFYVSHYADRLFDEDEEHFTRVIENGADGSPPPCSAIKTP